MLGPTVPVPHTIKRNGLFTFSNRPDTRKKGEKDGMLKQITSFHIFLNMNTNENPILYRIVVCLERETSWVYRYTGLYQSSNSLRFYSKTGFIYVFLYGCHHSYGAPNQSTGMYLSMLFIS